MSFLDYRKTAMNFSTAIKVMEQLIKVLGIKFKIRCNSNTENIAKMLAIRFRSWFIEMK